MTDKQPEALVLADALLDGMSDEHWNQLNADAATLIRTQHAELSHLKDAMGHLGAALARKDALLRQAADAMYEAQTYTGSASWSPSMTKDLQALCLAITKELSQ